MIWKGARRAIQVIISFLFSSAVLTATNTTLTPDQTAQGTAALTALTTGALESTLNLLKQKFPKSLGWL